MKKQHESVRIGCGAGFWGDTDTGAEQLVMRGEIDYLVFDYLAEITMSLLTRAKQKDPTAGYASDFVTKVMRKLGREIVARKIKVVTNAGGVNPIACRDAVQEELRAAGVEARIAVVLGDDVTDRIERFRSAGIVEMFNGRKMPSRLTSANAYLGAGPVARALAEGADIVITGRCVDSAVVLGPLMHEFGWSGNDYDLLSAGSLLGHLVECGCMGTGGLFSDWEDVPGWDDMGFPIIECHADGTAILTKPPGTGGLVSPATVSEQLVYEIGDPAAYSLPDVVCDWTEVCLAQEGPNRVLISGARGRAPSGKYKVCATHQDGWRATTSLTVVGGDARRKARRVGESILAKCKRLLAQRSQPDYVDTSIEIVGADEMYGPSALPIRAREVMLKIAVRHAEREPVELYCHEIMPALTATAAGIAGFFAGRPSPVPVIRLFSMLVDKADVPARVLIDDREIEVNATASIDIAPKTEIAVRSHPVRDRKLGHIRIPLARIARARSGDKGDHANIGVVARQPEYFEVLKEYLTADVVHGFFEHFVTGNVRRFELHGVTALNFMLENALGGGGTVSLRIDPQGKCFAPILLDMELSIPAEVARDRGLT